MRWGILLHNVTSQLETPLLHDVSKSSKKHRLSYSNTTSNSLVESLTAAVGGSCIRIWMRTTGWSALTTSLSRVSWETGRTIVSIPSAASVQILVSDGRFTLRSTNIISTRAERETANAIASMKPPRLAAICTVLTTTRNGWASSGTGYLPSLTFGIWKLFPC